MVTMNLGRARAGSTLETDINLIKTLIEVSSILPPDVPVIALPERIGCALAAITLLADEQLV